MRYDDILEYPYEMRHKRMSIENRCAQFAPFSALTGFTDLINEENREVERKRELTDEEKNIINQKLLIIKENILEKPMITITYFQKDIVKNGGIYKEITGIIKKINLNNLVLETKEKIRIDDIMDITSNDIKLDFE